MKLTRERKTTFPRLPAANTVEARLARKGTARGAERRNNSSLSCAELREPGGRESGGLKRRRIQKRSRGPVLRKRRRAATRSSLRSAGGDRGAPKSARNRSSGTSEKRAAAERGTGFKKARGVANVSGGLGGHLQRSDRCLLCERKGGHRPRGLESGRSEKGLLGRAAGKSVPEKRNHAEHDKWGALIVF